MNGRRRCERRRSSGSRSVRNAPAVVKDLAASGLPDTKVDCLDTIKVKEGKKVTCTATGSGGRGSELTFSFSSANGTIDETTVSGSGA